MLVWKMADATDLEHLVSTRVEVLRAANQLDETVDMHEVEKQSRAYYTRALAEDTHVAILVFDGDLVVATGGVSFFEVMPTYHNPTGKKAYVMNMYTAPAWRRQGIARKTLDLLVQACKERGVKHITLEATQAGRPLYASFGFVPMEDEMILPEEEA